ncbi:MAG TPA: hypothetical protein VFY23_01095 [Candidatus Limnocylindrales bacterium]|nr:hypothetical protein [Candidatus Limnocylindrales bacterium]
MRTMAIDIRARSTSRASLVAALAGILLATIVAAPVTAAGGASTPGVTVTAVNPTGTKEGSDLVITLTAQTEASSVPSPSCRPQDRTLECWGALVLRIPKYGDLMVGEFQVHRVAVGDITCGDDDGDDGCGDHEMPATALAPASTLKAQVNGVGVVKWSGNTGLPVGTMVQVKLTLTDNGKARYLDQVVVQVNLFVPGPTKPLLYQSGPETIQQVQIHFVDEGS